MMNGNFNNGEELVVKRGRKTVPLEIVMINGVEYWRPLVAGVDMKPLYLKACKILEELGINSEEQPPRMQYEVDMDKGSVLFWITKDVNLFDLAKNQEGDAA